MLILHRCLIKQYPICIAIFIAYQDYMKAKKLGHPSIELDSIIW